MSNPEFTPQGLEIQEFNEIYQQLSNRYREIYGQEINLDPDSPDGQRLGILTTLSYDLQAFALNLYNQMDSDLAFGEWLNKLIKFAGISRRTATRSQVDVTVTTDRDLILPANYTVLDDLEQEWFLPGALNLSTGATAVTLLAREFGEVEAEANTVSVPETIVLGVVSVDNADPALVGRDEETDEELRIRRAASVENPSYSTVGGLMARLGDVSGVTDVIVYENDQPTYDGTRDIDPNTIWAVVEGGTVEDIVETLVKHRTSGVGTKGDVSGQFFEEIPRPSGPPLIIEHEMNFDRPEVTNLFVTVNATRANPDDPVDDQLIAQEIARRTYRIAENARASHLYEFGYRAAGNFILTDLEISSDDSTYTDGRIVAGFDEKFVLDVANITVTEIIP